MKAYLVSSWGDNEYFLNRKDAEARRDVLVKAEKESDLPSRHKKIKPEVYEIKIN